MGNQSLIDWLIQASGFTCLLLAGIPMNIRTSRQLQKDRVSKEDGYVRRSVILKRG